MRRGHSLDTLLSLALFGLFAGCLLLVLMLGARSYQGVIDASEGSYAPRTCLQYIATKTSHYSGENAIALTQFGDGDALALYQEIDGCQYVTYLYLHDSQLMELFCEVDVALPPEAGFFIMEISQLQMTLVDDSLLSLSCEEDGISAQLYLQLHLGEGVAS